jgi:hypothetical protein
MGVSSHLVNSPTMRPHVLTAELQPVRGAVLRQPPRANAAICAQRTRRGGARQERGRPAARGGAHQERGHPAARVPFFSLTLTLTQPQGAARERGVGAHLPRGPVPRVLADLPSVDVVDGREVLHGEASQQAALHSAVNLQSTHQKQQPAPSTLAALWLAALPAARATEERVWKVRLADCTHPADPDVWCKLPGKLPPGRLHLAARRAPRRVNVLRRKREKALGRRRSNKAAGHARQPARRGP